MTSDERKARIHERTMRDPIWRNDADGTMTSPASDGTEDDVDQGCCTDRCTGACGGYGFAFELAARNLRDGTGHWAQLDGTCWVDCPACASDGTKHDDADFFEEDEPLEDVVTAFEQGERRVTFIGQPVAGKSELAGCCGERCDGTEEDIPFEGELPGFVGMIHGGKADLARRVKEIVRGEKSREDAAAEALRRFEEGPTMPSFSPAERNEVLRRLASNDGPVDGSSVK